MVQSRIGRGPKKTVRVALMREDNVSLIFSYRSIGVFVGACLSGFFYPKIKTGKWRLCSLGIILCVNATGLALMPILKGCSSDHWGSFGVKWGRKLIFRHVGIGYNNLGDRSHSRMAQQWNHFTFSDNLGTRKITTLHCIISLHIFYWSDFGSVFSWTL